MAEPTKIRGNAVVVGGGIAGIQASLDLADMGYKVFLVEKSPAIGGTMAQLDKTFPTNDCSMCILSPKLVDCSRHENITIMSNSDVLAVDGEAGKFSVRVLKRPRYVDMDKCTSCGDCVKVCPVSLPDKFEHGLKKRKAIYKYYPQAIPNAYIIDKTGDGKHRGCVNCKKCSEACKAGAINHDDKEEEAVLEVGAVILATGADAYNPSVRAEFGYGKYANVVTSMEFERIMSASGPYEGRILRPSDKKAPKKVAWVQCVGSRDVVSGGERCSSMCCMYTAKEAVIAKEHDASIEPTVFFIDVRSYGKDFDRYVDRARKEHGLRYIRSRISEVREDPCNRNLLIRYEDDKGDLKEDAFDLVVLSVGLCTTAPRGDFLRKMGLDVNEFGFCATDAVNTVATARPGIFIVGTSMEPQAIPESVMQASASASLCAELMRKERGALAVHAEFPPERDVGAQEPRVGVFVCRCGINIGGYLDVPGIAEFARGLEGVAHAEENIYTCSEDTQKKIKDAIKAHELNRVVVAACTPRTHEPLFQATVQESGLNPHLFEMANIREHCSWVHMDRREEATEKAKRLVAMAVAKSRTLVAYPDVEIPVTPKALVIGGGIAGMTAALGFANNGFETVIVEKDAMLGGKLSDIRYTAEGYDPGKLLEDTVAKVESSDLIRAYTRSALVAVDGFVGNFVSTIRTLDGDIQFKHGVVVVAVGSERHAPSDYGHGGRAGVTTQEELEKTLHGFKPGDIRDGETYTMIQCVGSRNEERPYCSRVCCINAVKNAIRIKNLNPKAEVFVLYRDMMTYGFKEKFYSDARKKGVMFIQYEKGVMPEVVDGDKLQVKVHEPMLQKDIVIPTDHLVLSTGFKHGGDNDTIAKMLKVPTNDDGFFLEAHVKLRPVDFATEGIFLAGSCHSPKFVTESIYQAQAAVARASTVLSRPVYRSKAPVSQVNEDLCCGCGVCVPLCDFKAIELVTETRGGVEVVHSKVNPALCKGCGTCVAACPSGALEQKGFLTTQIVSMIGTALARKEKA